MEKINLHAIIPVSEANGPGKRSVIWVQGCIFDCTGCFNQAARSFFPYNHHSVEEVFDKIPLDEVEGITISGGEPFVQASLVAELCELVKSAGLSVMVYSGYTLEQLECSPDHQVRRLLAQIDVLVDGHYIEEIPPTSEWAGSGNQRIHFLTNCYTDYKDKITGSARVEEVHISKEGKISLTGF